MKGLTRKLLGVTLAIAVFAGAAQGANINDTTDGGKRISGSLKTATDDGSRGQTYLGRNLDYWLKVIQKRSDEDLELALTALAEFGPDAESAVPELTRIVATPFMPIDIEEDSVVLIQAKLHSIVLRARAIDVLAAIGPAAASSAATLVQWALTVKVIPPVRLDLTRQNIFVDMVSINVMERMRVAGAVAGFGTGAAPVVSGLLRSADGEKRKLAVAILNETALDVASGLLKSDSCDDRLRGLAILTDMWPVVAKEHLADLRGMIVCDAN